MMIATLRSCAIVTALSLAGVGTWSIASTHAQGKASGDWLSHNFDLHNTRFSPLDQINTSNASGLKEQWTIQAGGADLASSRGHSILELAMSWLLHRPVVASVIAGATSPEQVHANVRAASWQLTDADLAEIDRIAPATR